MRLYHFTCEQHLPCIKLAGQLTTTESNLSQYKEHAGPDVVWLTSDPDPDPRDIAVETSAADKTAVRFTVEIPDDEAHPWIPWSRKRGIKPKWRRAMERGRRPEAWYVVERPIPSREWIAVDVATVARGPE